MKHVELNTNIVGNFVDTEMLNMIYLYPDFYVVTEITKKSDEDINKFVLMLGKGVLGFLTPPQLA